MSTRLSQSGLWDHQRAYYHNNGVTAWTTDTVPHYVTNCPIIGCGYADVILGYLEDLERSGSLDFEQPVCIVEMGGGSGRLAHYILRRLETFREQLPVRLIYVLTDFTETNLKHWRENPKFAPYFEQGVLDLALFDAETTQELHLERSGIRLDGTGNPVVFVANYLFDTISVDCFRIEQGQLQEALTAIQYGEDQAEVTYTYQDAGDAPYGRSDYDTILERYRQTLGDTHFLFPIGSLRCLDNLAKISGNRTCLITADKSSSRWDDFLGLDSPILVAHGTESFSFTANFHAMAMYWEGQGGFTYCTTPRDDMLDICCFTLGLPTSDLKRTYREFDDKLDRFGPLDFLNLRNTVLSATFAEGRSFQFCLELLRLSFWDPEILYEVADALALFSDELESKAKRELFSALSKVWDNYFPIGESRDVPFEIARILFRLEYYEPSLQFYDESLRLFGPHKMTYHNMGLCHYHLRRLGQSRAAFQQALDMDPGYGLARDWLIRIATELEESGSFAAISV